MHSSVLIFYWFVQFIYTLLCLWLLIFILLAIPKLENKYVAQGNSEYWSGWSIHSARSLGALITASSPSRCEVSHGRRPIPWVRKPRGFFIVILSFSSSHIGEMLISTELNAGHAERGSRAYCLTDDFKYFYCWVLSLILWLKYAQFSFTLISSLLSTNTHSIKKSIAKLSVSSARILTPIHPYP